MSRIEMNTIQQVPSALRRNTIESGPSTEETIDTAAKVVGEKIAAKKEQTLDMEAIAMEMANAHSGLNVERVSALLNDPLLAELD